MQATIAPVTLMNGAARASQARQLARAQTHYQSDIEPAQCNVGSSVSPQLVQFTPDDADHDETHHGQCE